MNPPSGCRFHTRCWLRKQLGNPERCATERPALRELGAGHGVSCHFAEQLTDPVRRDQLVSEAAATSSARDVAEDEEVGPGGVPPSDPSIPFNPSIPLGGDTIPEAPHDRH